MLSGNTDCYQPQGGSFKSRVRCCKYWRAIGIRRESSLRTVWWRATSMCCKISRKTTWFTWWSRLPTLNEDLRRAMEPRTASGLKRLKVVCGIIESKYPGRIIDAPLIPGLNHHEIPAILKAASEHGALTAGMTVVRLNGSIGKIFEGWLRKIFPDRFDKVWNQIYCVAWRECKRFTIRQKDERRRHVCRDHPATLPQRRKYFTGRPNAGMTSPSSDLKELEFVLMTGRQSF